MFEGSIERIFAGENSWYSVSVLMSSSRQAMLRYTCSKGEIHSVLFSRKWLTGLMNLASFVWR